MEVGGGLVSKLGQQRSVCMSGSRIISSGAEKARGPPVILRTVEDRWVDSAPASRLASSFASRGTSGSSRPGGRFIVAEYKPLFEISWNAYDFASERAFNVPLQRIATERERESTKLASFRGELRLNVLARLLAPLQTSRLGLNFDSELRKQALVFFWGGRPCDALRVKGRKKEGGEIGEFGTLVDIFLDRREREMEGTRTRYQENR